MIEPAAAQPTARAEYERRRDARRARADRLLRRFHRVTRTWRRAARAAAYYEHRLAVLDGDWTGRGEPGNRYLDDTHPYAADLDLFGDGSLYELLCTARTRAGQDTLAVWLLRPAPAAEVR